jgi:hypothetical protein
MSENYEKFSKALLTTIQPKTKIADIPLLDPQILINNSDAKVGRFSSNDKSVSRIAIDK